MEVLLPDAGMIEKKKNKETWFRAHLQSATPKSPTCAQRARWSTTQTRPDQMAGTCRWQRQIEVSRIRDVLIQNRITGLWFRIWLLLFSSVAFMMKNQKQAFSSCFFSTYFLHININTCTALPRVKFLSNPRRIHSEEEDEEKEERGLLRALVCCSFSWAKISDFQEKRLKSMTASF